MYYVLDKIRNNCDTYQRNDQEAYSFLVSIPGGHCVFNIHVSMEIISMEGASVVHVVDRDTKFGSDFSLPCESAAEVWKYIMNIWVSKYVVFPDFISLNQEPKFVSQYFRSLLGSAGVQLQPSVVD